MAEYNMIYLNLKKRLSTLKLLTESDTKISEDERSIALAKIDKLQKNLDERYSDGLLLSLVESEVHKIECK